MSAYQPPIAQSSYGGIFGQQPKSNNGLLGRNDKHRNGFPSNPDDMMVSLKSSGSRKYDQNEDDETELEIKESSSLLGSSSNSNPYQAKPTN